MQLFAVAPKLETCITITVVTVAISELKVTMPRSLCELFALWRSKLCEELSF